MALLIFQQISKTYSVISCNWYFFTSKYNFQNTSNLNNKTHLKTGWQNASASRLSFIYFMSEPNEAQPKSGRLSALSATIIIVTWYATSILFHKCALFIIVFACLIFLNGPFIFSKWWRTCERVCVDGRLLSLASLSRYACVSVSSKFVIIYFCATPSYLCVCDNSFPLSDFYSLLLFCVLLLNRVEK